MQPDQPHTPADLGIVIVDSGQTLAARLSAAFKLGFTEGRKDVERLQVLLDHAEQYARDLQDGQPADLGNGYHELELAHGRWYWLDQLGIRVMVDRRPPLTVLRWKTLDGRQATEGKTLVVEWGARVDEPHPRRREKPGDVIKLAEDAARYAPTIWQGWTTVRRERLVGPWEPAEQPEPAPCCDLHGRNCEQGGEECCERCTEAHHFKIGHGGVPCSSPHLSALQPEDGAR